jgi:hypothetical protein
LLANLLRPNFGNIAKDLALGSVIGAWIEPFSWLIDGTEFAACRVSARKN